MNKEHIDKLLSARFWLTIITGIVFAYATYKKLLEAQAVSAIIATVFQAYFSRNDRNGKPSS